MKHYKLHNTHPMPYGLIEWLIIVLYIILASALSYRLVFYPTAQLVPFLALALAAIFIIWRPVLGTALYFLSYPLVPSSSDINLMKLVMLLLTVFLFALWLWKKLKTRDHVWEKKEYKWLFLFFGYLCFSPFLGPANGFSVMDWARDIAPLLNLLLVPMLAEQLSDRNNRWLIYFLSIPITLAFLRDLFYLSSAYLPIPFNPFNLLPYRMSTFHIGLAFCIGILFYAYKIKPKYYWLGLALISLGNTFLTITRTVWISVAFTMGQMTLFFTKFRRISIIFIIVCIIAIGWLYFLPQEQAVSLKSYESQGSWLRMQTERIYGARHKDIAIMNRNVEFSQAKDKFLSSPLYGMGFGYIYRFWRYHVSGRGGSGFLDTNFTHNDMINFLAKGGIVGFALWAAMLYGLLRRLYKKRMMNKGSVYSILPTVGIIAIYNSLFVGSSTPVYQDRFAMFFLTVILAVCLSDLKIENKTGNGSFDNNCKL